MCKTRSVEIINFAVVDFRISKIIRNDFNCFANYTIWPDLGQQSGLELINCPKPGYIV
jgi:hypothetical protein